MKEKNPQKQSKTKKIQKTESKQASLPGEHENSSTFIVSFEKKIKLLKEKCFIKLF